MVSPSYSSTILAAHVFLDVIDMFGLGSVILTMKYILQCLIYQTLIQALYVYYLI